MSRTSVLVLAALAALTLSPRAQNPLVPDYTWVKVNVDSGALDNPTAAEQLVYRQRITLPSAQWMQLDFAELTELRPGSRLEITASRDGGLQRFDRGSLAGWDNRSALFNGREVVLELYAAPGTAGNRVVIDRAMAGQPYLQVGADSICGPSDNRVQSTDPRQGRLFIGCTGWLIGNETMLSAGHCVDSSATRIIEFNVPLSTPSGSIVRSAPQDQYPFIRLDFLNQTVGADWGVNRVGRNSNTGLLPEQAQGAVYTIGTVPSSTSGQRIRITGYGSTSPRGTLHLAQKTHVDALVNLSGSRIGYIADTTGGNSGSPVIHDNTGDVVGIHTHGGCSSSGGNNWGTKIDRPDLAQAILRATRTPSDVRSFGNGCTGSGTGPSQCLSLNGNGGTLENASRQWEYAIEVRAVQPLTVFGFQLFTRSNGSSQMNTRIYADGGGQPGATLATGTMSVGVLPGFYTTTFASPVQIPAGATFYLAADYAGGGVFLPELTSGTPGTAFWRGTGAWSRSGLLTVPSFRVDCANDGILRLGAAEGPYTGSTYQSLTTGALGGATAVTFFGFSDQVFGGGQLPFDLGTIGADGCSLYISPDLPLNGTVSAGGTLSVQVPVPADQALVGTGIFQQSVVLDAAANARGVVTSNALELTFGG